MEGSSCANEVMSTQGDPGSMMTGSTTAAVEVDEARRVVGEGEWVALCDVVTWRAVVEACVVTGLCLRVEVGAGVEMAWVEVVAEGEWGVVAAACVVGRTVDEVWHRTKSIE